MCVFVFVCAWGCGGSIRVRSAPLRPEGSRGQPRPRHPCLMHHPALRGPAPQPERARYTQSGGLDGTLGKTARIIDPKLFSWQSLARILNKGCKHGDSSNLATLRSTTITHVRPLSLLLSCWLLPAASRWHCVCVCVYIYICV